MNIVRIVIVIFCVLESLNIMVLYFSPKSTIGNGVGVFKTIHEIDENETTFLVLQYLTRWVANVKVIFVSLSLVIVIFGDTTIQFYALVALMLSTMMFYVTLYPIMKKLDREEQLYIKGYSTTLAIMILSFIIMFVTAMTVFLITS